MTLTAHRPARPLSSLQGEDPAEVAAGLPGLPHGVTLDPEVLRDAACGEQDLELFYPDPGDLETERAAKQVRAGCPVREPCLEMALRTGDQHAILGGTTPEERARLRRQRQVSYARQQAAQRGTAATAHVARLLGVHVTDLHAALAHWGLEVPKLRQPAELVEDPVAAREAFGLVEQLGWVKAAQQVGVARRTLRAAFQQWGMGEPVHRGPRAPSRLVVDRAAA